MSIKCSHPRGLLRLTVGHNISINTATHVGYIDDALKDATTVNEIVTAIMGQPLLMRSTRSTEICSSGMVQYWETLGSAGLSGLSVLLHTWFNRK